VQKFLLLALAAEGLQQVIARFRVSADA